MALYLLGSIIIFIALCTTSIFKDYDLSLVFAIWGASLIIHDGITSNKKPDP